MRPLADLQKWISSYGTCRALLKFPPPQMVVTKDFALLILSLSPMVNLPLIFITNVFFLPLICDRCSFLKVPLVSIELPVLEKPRVYLLNTSVTHSYEMRCCQRSWRKRTVSGRWPGLLVLIFWLMTELVHFIHATLSNVYLYNTVQQINLKKKWEWMYFICVEEINDCL